MSSNAFLNESVYAKTVTYARNFRRTILFVAYDYNDAANYAKTKDIGIWG